MTMRVSGISSYFKHQMPAWISQRCESGFFKEISYHKLQIFCFPQTRFQRWTSILNKRPLALGLHVLYKD